MSDLATLQTLAAGLCQDARVSLETSERGWAWSSARRALLVPPNAVATLGLDACAGIVAHEIGHAFLSRYLDFDDLGEPAPYVRALFNAIDDPRVEAWMAARYPGSRRWIEAARRAHPPQETWLPAWQLLSAFVREGWVLGGDEPDAEVELAACAPHVLAALDATRAARRAYQRDFLPETNLASPPRDVLARHETDVAPHLGEGASAWAPSRHEAWVRVLARDATLLAQSAIVPVALAVLAADTARLARQLGAIPGLRSTATLALQRHDHPVLITLARGAVTGDERDPDRPVRDDDALLAQRILDELFEPTTTVREASLSADLSEAAASVTETASTESPTPYDEAFGEVASDVGTLVRALEEVLLPRRRLGSRLGYASGQRISMPRAMAFEADRTRPVDFWVRSTAPDRRSAAFLLLVDLSGSMAHDKIRHAIAATALFGETLTRLQVPFSIVGFQDECIPVHGFGAPFDEAARATIGSLRQEPSGQREGGHNQGLWNDDGPCLREAAEALLARSEDDRVLIVLSDGAPEGRRSNADDLRSAVADLTPLLTLVGLGIGEGTAHVSEFYPRALASVPLEELPSRVGALLTEMLRAA